MSRSEAAKARGQTGFLHPVRQHIVRVGRALVFAGGVKKEAWAAARRWLKNTQDPNGAWFGVRVTLTIDGKRVSNKVIAANYHPGKE